MKFPQSGIRGTKGNLKSRSTGFFKKAIDFQPIVFRINPVHLFILTWRSQNQKEFA
jgi:hypothetical protein